MSVILLYRNGQYVPAYPEPCRHSDGYVDHICINCGAKEKDYAIHNASLPK